MEDPERQAYDRGITIFSPDGRLYQVEYAREAVERGSASVGVRTDEGIVLLADKRVASSLMEGESIEKLHAVDDHVAVATAGHVADGRALIDFLRQEAQIERRRYGEGVGVETLAKALTDHVQRYTQIGGARPFGVATILGGIEDGEPRLFETDPSGTPYEWKALAVGADRDEIDEYLEDHYEAGMGLEAGVELALAALASVSEDPLTGDCVDLITVPVGEDPLTVHDTASVRSYLDGIDAGEPADEPDDEDADE